MSNFKKKSKPLELRVVFDTNAIFTESEAFLVKLEVSNIIKANSAHPDLRIRWYLPEVVRWEREFQMRENGFALLPSIAKVEKVLKHNLNITRQTIDERIPLLVNEQLGQLGIEIISFDPDSIDWSQLVKDATSRKPPFEKGEKEKGFRDAVILESFLQLIEQSPKTASSCLIVLVARDGLLTIAAKERTLGAKNIRFVEDVSALKGLINTLVAQVDEEFIEKIKPEAIVYFFSRDEQNPDKKSGLLYRAEVLKQITEKFTKELSFIPPGYDGKDWGNVYVNSARFSRKEGRRVYWVTRIEYEYKPFRLQVPESHGQQVSTIEIKGTTGSPWTTAATNIASPYLDFIGTTPVAGNVGQTSAIGGPWRPAEKILGQAAE